MTSAIFTAPQIGKAVDALDVFGVAMGAATAAPNRKHDVAFYPSCQIQAPVESGCITSFAATTANLCTGHDSNRCYR
jgi:hypothetical protein